MVVVLGQRQIVPEHPSGFVENFLQRLDIAFLLPLGISTVVLGFGYLLTFGGYPLPLRETWLIVPLIQSVMSVPLVIRLVYPALVAIDQSHLEAAATAGANRWQIWWFIELPMIRFSVYTAAAFAAPAAASMMQNAWTVRHVLQPLLG